jgi:hypothetical protein
MDEKGVLKIFKELRDEAQERFLTEEELDLWMALEREVWGYGGV